MKYICSLIVVEDVKKSRFLYETVLGCKVISDFGENIAFEGSFAIHNKNHYQQLIPNNPIIKRSNNFELYFEDDDLEQLEEKIDSNGLVFIHRIIEQPWKQRVIRFYDYEDNIIEIGERMEHVAHRLFVEGIDVKEIRKITYLSLESINEAIIYDKKDKVPTTGST